MTIYTNYKKIGDIIANKIAKFPKVKAVAYAGSMTSKFIDEISKDIDLVCIVSERPSIKERRRYLGEQKYSENSNSFIEIFYIGDVKIDIIFIELQWFENVLKKIAPEDEFNEKHILALIQNMKPIIDQKNIIKNFKKKIKYKEEYRVKKLEYQFHVLCNRKEFIIKSLKRKNLAFVNYLFSDSLERYVWIIFALNKKYYSDLKWAEKYIRKFKIKPKNAIKNIRRFSELGNSQKEINEKLKLLEEMILEILKVIKKEVPQAKIDKRLKKLL